jgi:hypothetical protein
MCHEWRPFDWQVVRRCRTNVGIRIVVDCRLVDDWSESPFTGRSNRFDQTATGFHIVLKIIAEKKLIQFVCYMAILFCFWYHSFVVNFQYQNVAGLGHLSFHSSFPRVLGIAHLHIGESIIFAIISENLTQLSNVIRGL